MKATFTGVPGEQHESITMYGHVFPLNKAVDVSDSFARQKLARHPHFKVERTKEDDQLDQQVRTEYAAAAQAGLMDAQAKAIREGRQAATAPAPAPTAAPTPLPMKSAQEYFDRVDSGAGLLPQLSEQELEEQLKARRAEREAREAAEKQAADAQAKQAKETTHGNAGRTGDAHSAKDEGGRSATNAERGRAGKGT